MASQKRLTKKQQSIAYQNSKPLKVRTAEGHPAIEAATDHLFKEMPGISARYGDKYRMHLQVFILDLYLTYTEDSERYVAFSRNKNSYRPGRKYHRKGLSHAVTVNVTDFLKNKGYASLTLGIYNPDNPYGKSYQARIRAKDKLIKLIESYGVTPDVEDEIPEDEDDNKLVILRAPKKKEVETVGKEIDYEYTPETLRMKENLKLINNQLKRHAILLYITDSELKELNKRRSQDPNRGPVLFKNKSLHRTFNNNSWTQGGRFYGGWWQNIPREYRHLIRIDDKPVVEADYSGLHINMLYAKEKIPMPAGDVYHLDEYSNDDEFRNFVKRMLLILVNSDDRDEARKALHKAVYKEKSIILPKQIKSTKAEHLNPLMDAFADKHKPISHYFCTGIGIDLQYEDSQIAEKVLVHFSKMGYAILPMHDSFILHHGLEHELQQAMYDASKGQFGVGFKTDIKYRSIEEQGPQEPTICEATLVELFSEDTEYQTYETLLQQHRNKIYGQAP